MRIFQSVYATGIGFFLALASIQVAAEDYPKKPIRLIVPFAAGTPSDSIARIFSTNAEKSLGQPIIVENKAGANGTIGAQQVAKSPADGYTILMGTNTPLAAAPSLYKNLSYDVHKSFTPVAYMGGMPLLVVVNPELPVKSLTDFVDFSKKSGTPPSFGSAASGQLATTELIAEATAIKLLHVPFKAATEVISAVIRGDVTLFSGEIVATLPLVKSGRLKALGVSSKQRSPLAPDIPTIAESLGKDFEVLAWYAVVAPANTPEAIVSKLNMAFNDVLKDPAALERINAMGLVPEARRPQQLARFMQAEIPKWANALKLAGVVAE